MNTDSETNENESEENEVQAPETGVDSDSSDNDEKQILQYLTEHPSPLIREKIKSEDGKQLCVSYVLKNVHENNCTIGEAVGWLQQFLEGS